MEKEKFIIIDSNALVHRAFHALPELSTRTGAQINAVYGFLLVLLKIIQDFKPDYLAATFDLAGPTFRHESYKAYKAKRVKAPDNLYQQIPIIKDFLQSLKIPVFEQQGFEADDVIGTISKKIPQKQSYPEIQTIILTGDLDTLQLIDKQTKVYTFKKGIKDSVIYDAEKVRERFGLEPDQMTDFRALKGDPSDNIPGVPGIGEKTASELIKEFGNLENLYFQIENKTPDSALIRDKIKKLLVQHKDQAFFSKVLSSIRLDVPIDFKIKDCEWNGFGEEFLNNLKKYEFFKILSTIQGETKKSELLAHQIEKLFQDGVFSEQIYKLEKDLLPVIEKMNENGIKIDLKKLKELNIWFGEKIEEASEEIYKESKEKFNINSPSQISDILFNKLKISKAKIKKTPKGEISTAFSELDKIKNSHPVIPLIIKHRELSKIKSSVIENLIELVDDENRIHPNFNQLGTVSGRLSCNQPNLQNIPKKGKLADAIRKCFVSENGFNLFSFDYSQMELRVCAYLSKDEKMNKFFNEEKDIHKMTASLIFEKDETTVTNEEREIGKRLNFSVIYGMGPYGFSEATGYSIEQATEFIAIFYQQFSGISAFKQKIVEELDKNKFTQTFFGRKRFFPELSGSLNFREKEKVVRMAFNHVVQGTSADIIKTAMVKIAPFFSNDVRLILQIHDELIFEIKNNKEDCVPKIKEIMESIFEMTKIEIEKGPNLGELKEFTLPSF
ncbi:MAG: DNA polymerase [bacterium]|nr:DNA polymerase [bacterium]